MELDEKTYNEIAQMIRNPDSPVGIHAERTHVYILHKLIQIEKRLDAIENRTNPDPV